MTPCALVTAALLALALTATNAQTLPKKASGNPTAPAAAPLHRGPTQDDLAQVAAVKSDIAAIERQIGDAQAESDKLAGGLIKARIEARIAQMKYTISLLQTRQKALEIAARFVPVEVVSTPVDEATAAKLDKEIEEQRARIVENDAKAAQYSGGLIRAQILSTSATMGETLAMMEQRRMIAKYGLAPAPAAKGGREKEDASATVARKPVGPREAPLQDTIIKVRLTNKQYHESLLSKIAGSARERC